MKSLISCNEVSTKVSLLVVGGGGRVIIYKILLVQVQLYAKTAQYFSYSVLFQGQTGEKYVTLSSATLSIAINTGISMVTRLIVMYYH